MRSSRAAVPVLVLTIASVATLGARAAVPHGEVGHPSASMVVIESHGTERELRGGQTDVTATESVWGDRRSIETDSRFTSPTGAAGPQRHRRSILALDRRVIWSVNLDDSSYTETPFEIAREYAARIPAWAKLGERPLGRGESIAGLATERFELRHRGPVGSGLDSVEFVTDVWVAHEGHAVAQVVALERRPRPRSTGVSAGAADLALRQAGIPVRIISRAQFPKGFDLSALGPAALSDSAAQSIGLDLKTRSLLLSGAEVSSIRTLPVARERFQISPGWTKKPSVEAETLKHLKSQGAPTAPGR